MVSGKEEARRLGRLDAPLSALLPDSAGVDGESLAIGGLSLSALSDRFGTPLYVYDEQTVRASARKVLAAFCPLDARVSFASKACDTIAVLRLLQEEGVDLDVVSEGELEASLRAGFRPEQIHLHGNCKSDAELAAAVRLGLHAVVVDNLEELKRLQSMVRMGQSPVRVMLRVSLALEAETHPHLQTSGYHSKFGFGRGSEAEQAALRLLEGTGTLTLTGIHAHLGSQITDLEIYRRMARELVVLGQELRQRGFPLSEISVGGGWGVPYRVGEVGLSGAEVASVLAPIFRGNALRPAIEPGRALVARAAVALYRVGSVKATPGGRIVAVDGGMGDNPRPALYGARYEALLVERATAEPAGTAEIVGRYCESGDVLARDVALPEVAAGDLICIPVAGAYQLSMASSYNRVPPPAAVLVSDGQARLVVRRATIEDVLAREVE